MSSPIISSLPWRRLSILAAVAILLASPGCDCNGEEEEEDHETLPDVPERDRSAEVPTPDLVGPAPDDFDPEDLPRIVDPEDWNITLRATGKPGAVPQKLIARVDRSVVRRGYPDIGEGTTITVTDEDGNSIDVGTPRLTNRQTIFRLPFDDDLVPGMNYEVSFEAVEFDFGEDDDGREDVDFFEFDEPVTTTVETPRMELVDVSSARPVSRSGYVELRFSAPVDPADLSEQLEWSLDGSAPRDVYYEVEEGSRVAQVRLETSRWRFASVSEIELTGGAGLTSTLGGEPSGAIDETISVGSDSDTLEIRMVGGYERAGTPAIRVICHDPNYGDTQWSYWDREIRRSSRDISRRCDVDADRAMKMVELDVDAELSFVDHQHGFDIMLDIDEPGGPVGFALRTGDYGEQVAELFEGREETLTPSVPAPELAIDADGRYLQRTDWNTIPIRHRDVELARVVVRHAASDHFLFWLSGDDEMGSAASFAIAEQYIELDPGPGDSNHSYIDMEALVGEPMPGAYQIEVSAPYQSGLSDSHRFLVSDIQLIAKRASHTDKEIDEIWAWTIDANSAEPVEEVELELVRNNGRVLADCTTDEEGYCELSGNWGDLENEPPFAVVAEGGDALAYVDWNDTKTEIVEGAVGGANYADQPAHRGSLRGERTIYRPGETMNFAGFVRGEGYGAEPGLPVGVEITDSRGQRAYGGVHETDSVGAVEFHYDVPEMAPTGTWNVELFAGDEEIASQEVSVEEFVPDRIEVQIDVDEEYVYDGDGIVGHVQADYFFGTPASNTDFEVECLFEPAHPFEDQWPQYDFGPFDDEVDSVTARTDGTLDGDGRAQFNCTPSDFDDRASYDVEVKASVFEAGSGSPTRSQEQTILLSGDEIVGLRSPDDRADETDGARIEGVVVGPGGAVVDDADSVHLELGSIRYTSTWIRRGGRSHWERERHESIDSRRSIDVDDGHFSFRAEPRGSSVGIYVRALHKGSLTEFEVDAPRRFWWWGDQDLDPRPDDPTHVAIDGPDEIVVGEAAQFSFDAPAPGRALVALETSRVDSWEWIDVSAGKNSWEVTVDYFDPNVYVSALYVPVGDAAPERLDRGFGVQRVDVSRQRWEADLELQVPEEREPYETLDIVVTSDNAGPNAKVAVAAVDRGILSLASYEFDNPLDQLFTVRALGVDTFDTVGWYADVSPERFGGGAMAPPQPAPEAIMPVEPTAMWSGLVAMEDGRAEIDFDIPDFRGELEVVAVLVDEEHLGEATEYTTVVDPLTLQATGPRFASHGDRIEVPVSVTNTTERSIDVELEADVLPDMVLYDDDTAALEISSASSASLSLDAGQRDDVVFSVDVVGRAGAPRLTFDATGGGESSHTYTTIPVYPDGPVTVEQDHHSVQTRSFNVVPHLDGWLPTSETTELWVTSIPRAPAFRHLDHVLRYPRLRLGHNLYNTVARVRPAVYLDELLQAANPGESTRNVNWQIRSALRGINRLQNRSGQFRYWVGSSNTVGVWGQAYVLDMLTSAEEAGHDVPQWVMRDGLDWLDRRVQRRQNIEDLDLAMWVLARNGRPNRRAARSLLDELPDNPSGRDHERALLATAALHIAGDETVDDDLRQLIANPNLDDRTQRFSGDFYSPARHEGLALEVGLEIYGTDSQLLEGLIERVADRLVDAEVGEMNLHELGWSIAPLGRWAEARAETIPDARLIAAGDEIEPQRVGDDGSRSWQLHRASEYPEVILEFDETPDTPVSVFRRTEGVHQDSAAEFGSQHLSLQRRYLDADGNAVDLNDVQVGDLVYVELTASHDEDRHLRDLSLTDRIPGGFEIEDPRPEGQLRPDWFDPTDEWDVDHFDVRDDRFEAYGTIRRRFGRNQSGGERVKLVYTIRATTAGTFSAPPSELVSMYQHDRWARIDGGTVRIHRP